MLRPKSRLKGSSRPIFTFLRPSFDQAQSGQFTDDKIVEAGGPHRGGISDTVTSAKILQCLAQMRQAAAAGLRDRGRDRHLTDLAALTVAQPVGSGAQTAGCFALSQHLDSFDLVMSG